MTKMTKKKMTKIFDVIFCHFSKKLIKSQKRVKKRVKKMTKKDVFLLKK